MTYLEQQIGTMVIKHRWWIILISLICVCSATFGMGNLSFSSDSRIFFSKENPQLKAMEALENTFTKDNNVMFTLVPEDGNVFTNKTLAAVQDLTRMCWEIPYSSRVDSISNFQNTYALNDDLVVEDLVSKATALSIEEIQRIRKIALSEILLVNRLISASGNVTGINVNILKQDNDENIVSVVVDHVKKITQRFKESYPEIGIYLTGTIISDKTFEEASKRDMITLIPIMFGMMILFIGIALRSVSSTIATIIVIAFSVLCGLGLAGWAGIVITPPSSNTPMIIMTLAIADSIHILVTILQQMQQGLTKNEAIKESVRINFNPIFLTSLTTAVGFLTMNFSDVPPFHDLGNIVAIGITAAFCFSIFFLPALMSILPLMVKRTNKQGAKPFDRIARFNIKYHRYLLPGLLVLSIMIILGIFKIELNDNFLKYFDHQYEFRRAADFMEENLSGINIIEYTLNSDEANGINNLDYLNTVDKFAQWYRTQPGVVHVNNVADIIKRLNKNMHDDNQIFYRIPRTRELAAQYFLLYDMSLPFGLDLNNQINVDKSSSRLTVTMKDASSRKIRETDERARQWLMDNGSKAMFTYGTGIDVIFAHISQRNIRTMLVGSVCAMILISGIIMIALRSVRLGIISLLPNLLPAFMAFGIWGITASQVGLALTIMVSLTLGIVVDDTVHFMSKYLRARREYGMPASGAVKYAFNTVGRALWVTTFILSAGFMVLSFSGFKMNSDLGIMTTITIVFAIGLDFFLLPSILIKAEGETDEKNITDHIRNSVNFPLLDRSQGS